MLVQPSQFAPTPRFGKSRTVAQTPRPRSLPKPVLVRALRASVRLAEDVEDAAEEDEDDEMLLDDEQAQALPTTEHAVLEYGDEARWMNDVALSPKRRRLDGNDASASSAISTFREPQTPASHLQRPTSHFAHFQLQPTPSSTSAEAATIQRPAFLRPSLPPQEPIEPLPQAFSPHRRGQKLVPGGIAATMQQWVIETGQAAVQSRRGQGYLRGEDHVTRAKVEQFSGTGPYTARARLGSGEAVNLLLAGGSDVNSSGMKVGSVVAIRAPTWDIELEGAKWDVGVDWRILS